MKQVYLGNFDSKKDVENCYDIKGKLKDCNIIIADYKNENYEGSSIVIFEENNKLYEVHGSHCSCYGLEGQWRPEDTDYETLLIRAKNGIIATDCSILIENLEEWKKCQNLNLKVDFRKDQVSKNKLNKDFDFDNIPDAKELVEEFNQNQIKQNISQIILENKIFDNYEEIIKGIKKEISVKIKDGLENNLESVEIKRKISLNDVLVKYMKTEDLNGLVLEQFSSIKNVLDNKNWSNFVFFKNDEINFKIQIPKLDLEEIPKNKSSIKTKL